MAGNLFDDALEQLAPAPVSPADQRTADVVDYLKSQDAAAAVPLRQARAQAADTDPDRAVKVQQLATQTGLPQDVVDRNYEDLAKRQFVDELPYRQVQEQTPALAQWAATPTNAAIAHDDMEKLGALEWLLKAPSRAVSQALNAQGYGALRTASLFRPLTRDEQDQLASYRYNQSLDGSLGTDGHWFRGALTGSIKLATQLASTMPVYGLAGGIGGAIVGGAGGSVVPGVGTVSGAVAGAKLGFEAGNVYGLGKMAFQQEAGNSYDHYLEFKDDTGTPIDPEVAKMAALATGAINAGLMTVGGHLVRASLGAAGEKLFGKATVAAIDQALKVPRVRAALLTAAKEYSTTLGEGTALMVGMKAVNILSGELAKSAAPGEPDYGYGPRYNQGQPGGAPKGLGYLGPLQRPDGAVMSEYSIGVTINGQQVEIPSIVPTLTREEVQSLLTAPDGTPPSPAIVTKATAFATQRLAAGKDVFARTGEQQPLYPDLGRAATPNAPRSTFTHITPGQAGHELLQAAIEGVQSFALPGALGPALSFAHEAQRAIRAQHGPQFFEALGDATRDSKTFQRLPEAAQAFVAAATKDGPIETLYTPTDTWRTYWQSKGVDPVEMADRITGKPGALETAERTGHDLPIETARYASTIAPTEHNAFFANELRLGPDEMNGRESQAFEEQLKAKPVEATAPGPGDQVRQAIAERLEAAGVPRETTSHYAQLYESTIVSLAERAGLDPMQLFERYGLTITREGIEPEGGQTPPAAGEAPPESTPPAAGEGEAPGAGALPLEAASGAAETLPAAFGPNAFAGPELRTADRRTAAGESPTGEERRIADRRDLSGRDAAMAGGTFETSTKQAVVDAANRMRAENPKIDKQAATMRTAGEQAHAERKSRPRSSELLTRNEQAAQTEAANEANAPELSPTRAAARDSGEPAGHRVAPSYPRIIESTRKDASGRERTSSRGETPRERAERTAAHYDDLFSSVLADARSVDPTVDDGELRAEFDRRVEIYDDLKSLYRESGHDPKTLLQDIAARGGLFESEGGLTGELRDLKEGTKFGSVGGVAKVFRGARELDSRGKATSGLSLDDMLTSLQQEPQYAWLENTNQLLDAIDEVARHGLEGDALPGTDTLRSDLNINTDGAWWLDSWRSGPVDLMTGEGLDAAASEILEPDGPVDTSFNVNEFNQSLFDELEPPNPTADELTATPSAVDTLDTGEEQPRLPAAGTVREQHVETPAVAEAPFTLTSEIAKPRKGKQSTLFQGPAPLTAENVAAWANELKQRVGPDLQVLDLQVYGNDLLLAGLSIDRGAQRAGLGSSVMRELTRFADLNGKRIVLNVAHKDDIGPGQPTSRGRLVEFYKRFGFVENKGAHVDYTLAESMYREPTAPVQANARDLIVQHNLTAANLAHAIALGGIPVPSLAITTKGEPLTNFGEITLLGPKEMANPRNRQTRVFSADTYAPRYPTVHFDIPSAGEKRLAQIFRTHADRTGARYIDLDSLQKEGPRYLETNGAMMAEFLTQRGLELPAPVLDTGKYAQPGQVDQFQTRYALEKAIQQAGLEKDFTAFARQTFDELGPVAKIFRGFTDQGNRSYQAHTIENVVRHLKRDLAGGETEGNVYGTGQLRARLAPEFRSLAEIRAAKHRLVSDADFDVAKKQVETQLFDLAGELAPYYQHDSERFGYLDTILAVVEDVVKRGPDRTFNDYGFEGVPDDVTQHIRDFAGTLVQMPTEYFEAKLLRAVDVGEFKAAIVPTNADPAVVEQLQRAGLDVSTYDRADGGEQGLANRRQAVAAAADRLADTVLFQSTPKDEPFYSRLARAVSTAKVESATGGDWKNIITGSKAGINRDEFAIASVHDLEDGEHYTRAEVLEYLKANNPRIVTVELATAESISEQDVEARAQKIYDRWVDAERDEVSIDELDDQVGSNLPSWSVDYDDDTEKWVLTYAGEEEGSFVTQEAGETHAISLEDNHRDQLLADFWDRWEPQASYAEAEQEARDELQADLAERGGVVQYPEYVERGAESGSYREIFLTVPDLFQRRAGEALSAAAFRLFGKPLEELSATQHGMLVTPGRALWSDGHEAYDGIQNPIVRIRLDRRLMTTEAGDQRVLFLEEVQPPHAKEPVPKLYARNWRELAFKWALQHAAETGADRVAWTTGKMQAQRYSLEQQVGELYWRVPSESEIAEGATVVVQIHGRPAAPARQVGNVIRFGVNAEGNVIRGSASAAAERLVGAGLDDVVGKELARRIMAEQAGKLTGPDLAIGGEGLKRLYDVDFANVVNKLAAVKKAGARVTTEPLSFGSSYGVRALEDVQGVTLTPALRAALAGGQALFQEGSRRGAIRFGPDRQFSIALLERADLSTFLHESGHFFLEVFGDLADQARALENPTHQQQRLVADFDGVLKFLGVETRDQVQTPHHEQFARAFEAYLMEGKAPSVETQGAFARFRAWLVGIYKNLSALKVELTPEVRGILDRMVATDRAIQDAEAQRGVTQLFTTPESAGMTPGEFDLYRATVTQAAQTARETLDRKIFAQVQRERTREYQAARGRIRGDVEAETFAKPEYRALAAMRNGTQPNGDPIVEGMQTDPMRLSREIVAQRYGAERLAQLPRTILSTSGGLDPDVVAHNFGFSSGDELLHAVTSAPPMKDVIASETARRLVAEQGNILLDGTLPDTAKGAISNEDRDTIIRAEMRALGQLRRNVAPFVEQARGEGRAAVAALEEQARQSRAERDYERRWLEAEAKLRIAIAEGHKQVEIDDLRATVNDLKARARGGPAAMRAGIPSAALLRDIARARIAETPIRDLKPDTFWSASRRARQQAIERVARQDWDGGSVALQQELINLNLYREAERALEDVQTRTRFAQDLGTDAARARLGKAGGSYLEQVDGILERFDFSKQTKKAVAKRAALRDWAAGLESQGLPVDLPEELLNESYRRHYSELPLNEFLGITDGLKQIVHLAQLKNRLLKIADKRELDVTANAIGDSIRANHTGGVPEVARDRRNAGERARTFGDLIAAHRKMASLARELDGFKDGGPMWEAVIRPLNEASAREASMNAEATRKFGDIVEEAYPGGREKRQLYDKVFVPSIGASLSKMERLMIALNWGNDGNRDRVRASEAWRDDQVSAVLNTLDDRDARFVQNVFDAINDYWPEIAAKQERVYGIAPEKVEARPFFVGGVEIPGGYFPIKYDDRLSANAAANLDFEAGNLAKLAAYAQATTQRGHTKARLENAPRMPLRRDFGVMFEHVTQVIHDLAFHETLIDVGRVLGHRAVQSAIYDTKGDITYRQFKTGVRDTAFGDIPGRNAFERSLNNLRAGATVAGLGWSLTTAMLHFSGSLPKGIVRIGPEYMARGLLRWTRDAVSMENTAKWIDAQSEMMRTRGLTQQRELNEIRNAVGVNTGKFSSWISDVVDKTTFGLASKQGLVDSYFYLVQQMQKAVDVPTWLGAYEKAMDAGELEPRAIAMADQAVLDAFGGGQVKDLAAVQRGGPMMRLWTNFYSPFNATFNLSAESLARTKWSSPGSVGRLAVDYLMLYTLPATLGYAIHHAARGAGLYDDAKDVAAELVRANLAYMADTMVGLRELSGVIQGYYGYEGPAGASIFADVSRLWQQSEHAVKKLKAGDEHPFDETFWRSLNDVGGIVFHYPSNQVGRTLSGLQALEEGRTSNPMALITGPPPKNQK